MVRGQRALLVLLSTLVVHAYTLQIVMAALVIVLAFFFMPGNDSSDTMLMRVRALV